MMWCVVGCVPLIRELQQNKLDSRVGVVDNNVQIHPSAIFIQGTRSLNISGTSDALESTKICEQTENTKIKTKKSAYSRRLKSDIIFLFWLICFLARNKFLRRLISANDHRRSSTKGSSKLLRLLSPILEIHQRVTSNLSTGIQSLLNHLNLKAFFFHHSWSFAQLPFCCRSSGWFEFTTNVTGWNIFHLNLCKIVSWIYILIFAESCNIISCWLSDVITN